MTRKRIISQGLAGLLLGIAGILLFSTKAVFVKLAYRYEVDPVTLLLFRMLLVGDFTPEVGINTSDIFMLRNAKLFFKK